MYIFIYVGLCVGIIHANGELKKEERRGDNDYLNSYLFLLLLIIVVGITAVVSSNKIT